MLSGEIKGAPFSCYYHGKAGVITSGLVYSLTDSDIICSHNIQEGVCQHKNLANMNK